MKKEDVISAGIMTLVSILVLVGFTVAWYSKVFTAFATGMKLKAAEMNSITIALTEDGPDISTLEGDSKYVDIHLQQMTNVEADKLAPGQFGEVTFYVTPSDEGIVFCEIMPTVWIRVGDENVPWYTGEEASEGEVTQAAELYEITQRHIDFFADAEMTQKVDMETPFHVDWSESDGNAQKEMTIYWKWYYEYLFSAEELQTLTAEEKENLINNYDAEDTRIGNNITAMKFHFAFSAQ